MHKLLIVDDDVAVTNYIMIFLMQTELYEPTIINDSREVPDLLERETFDAVLLDMDMPGLNGMDILKLAREREISTPMIILTGVNDVDLAVKSLKLGAFDYLTKPVDDDYLLEVLDKAIQHGATLGTLDEMPEQLKHEDLTNREAFDHLPTKDEEMIRLFHRVERMAPSDLCLFIIGERGTGKNSLAIAVHSISARKSGPFVAVDAAAFEAERFAAEFFGQTRNRDGQLEEHPGFLDEADGGTLFLNNIEDLTRPVQRRLNRVIKAGEFYRESSTHIRKINVRVIASSRHDLSDERFSDTFSHDLLYHLMVHSLRIPSLRERKGDIENIAEHFLRTEADKDGRVMKGFEPRLLDLFLNYEFPGNLQELRDIIATALRNEESNIIGVDSLAPYMRDMLLSGKRRTVGFEPRKLAEVEREHIRKTLAHFDGDKSEAALALDIPLERLEGFDSE
ncbi:MAG: sigma-54-dependent Fis family transcriptional regulator [bacterium]|nr:sigma-54-dependent Fis family transcriptional regulator [bacterium]